VRSWGGLYLLTLVLEALRIAVFSRLPALDPDVILGAVVLVAILRSGPMGAWMGLCLGLTRDLFYGWSPGTEALPLAVVGWAVGSLGKTVYREAVLTQVVIVFLAGLGKGIFGYLMLRGGETAGLFPYLFRILFPSAVWTAILVPVIFNVLKDQLDRRLWELLIRTVRTYEKKLLVKRT
jgi:rod shape-determining protein MreD